jgi:phage gpG-like protein
VRGEPAANLPRVERKDDYLVGVLGTTVPYARIHEFGGTIPAHSITITDKMRRFFWAMFYNAGGPTYRGYGGDADKWQAIARTRKTAVDIPAITMKARPFLNPAIRDPEIVAQARTTVPAAYVRDVRSALKLALSGGRP